MLSLITLVVGIIIFLKGGFRFGNRTVLRPQARSIGLILMAPLAIQFCASSLLVYRYVEFNEDGTFTLSANVMESIAGTLGMIELIAVFGAIGLALYNIYGRTPTDVASKPSQPQQQMRPMPQQVPDIMTVAEAAAYMRVSETDVLELIEQGRLGAARIGNTYRIARIAVDDFMGRA